jgi:hypothetical protein
MTGWRRPHDRPLSDWIGAVCFFGYCWVIGSVAFDSTPAALFGLYLMARSEWMAKEYDP